MPIREIGSGRTRQEQRTGVAVSNRTGDKGIADGFGVELAFGEEDLLADPAEDVERELIGAHEIVDRKIDPDIERDLTVRELRIADQMRSVDGAEHLFDLE